MTTINKKDEKQGFTTFSEFALAIVKTTKNPPEIDPRLVIKKDKCNCAICCRGTLGRNITTSNTF